MSQNSEKGTFVPSRSISEIKKSVDKVQVKSDIPKFCVGDTVKVHARIREGGKERIQIFEGVVIRRSKGNQPSASFTVRKISYNVGVERVFLVHSPRIEKIEVSSPGSVRRARLYYLRELSGKSARIKRKFVGLVTDDTAVAVEPPAQDTPAESA